MAQMAIAVKEEIIVHNDTYFRNLPTYTWQKVVTTGKKYSPRTGHECVYYNKKIYLFGGTDHDDRKNDLYCFDIYTSNWEKMIH